MPKDAPQVKLVRKIARAFLCRTSSLSTCARRRLSAHTATAAILTSPAATCARLLPAPSVRADLLCWARRKKGEQGGKEVV